MPLPLGTPAPWFVAESHENPHFAFSSLGGRFVLLAFPPRDEPRRADALDVLERAAGAFGLDRLVVFAVASSRPEGQPYSAEAKLRWFFDPGGEVAKLYGATDSAGQERPHWILLDPTLRVFATGGFAGAVKLDELIARLPPAERHAGAELLAPVLIVPRILEPAICQRLIACYEREGGTPSGVMRDIGGRTVGVLDDFKRRRDVSVADEGLKAELRARIAGRLLPEIRRAFQFKATRMERYTVACYDAEDGGYFRAHRDDTTLGTAHRRFACSINLNADEYDGGDLRFPEFGRRRYRPPTGGALVFSCSLLHEATPVTRGRRYAFLPFFYDEEAARTRQQNLRFLGAAESQPSALAMVEETPDAK